MSYLATFIGEILTFNAAIKRVAFSRRIWRLG